MASKAELLKKYFGHSVFRAGQERIIDSIMSGRDALCIMPTGAGKSVCYQIPALMLGGITLVISPLISLMKDQVTSLVQNGVAAAYINSSLTAAQYGKVLLNVMNGKYKIIYVAPERLDLPEFVSVCQNLEISFVAVDEAHCVSQWGQDFRPAYLKIAEFVSLMPKRPVVGAFTATATDSVRADIEKYLRLREPFKITTGFDRPNLRFTVYRPAARDKRKKLTELLSGMRESSGIIYCATRKTVEEVCGLLISEGYGATRYHAGLSDAERKSNQEDFIFDRKPIMVATNAFGMGIDKSNVSFVIHYNMPKNIESYYQEAGRAGRDGESAECILLYAPGDVKTNELLINYSEANPSLSAEQQRAVHQKDLERLKQMTFYSTTNDCLRGFILKYFGESAAERCGNCSSCCTEFTEMDVTSEAQKVLSCVIRSGQKYGRRIIADILRGSKSERVTGSGLRQLTVYGLLKGYRARKIYSIIDRLESEGYIRSVGDEFPVLTVTERADEILYGGKKLFATVALEDGVDMEEERTGRKKKEKRQRRGRGTEEATPNRGSADLESALKKLRNEIAAEKSIPAYLIFSNAAIADMARRKPVTDEEFLAVSGVGNAKLRQYGKVFTEFIGEYLNSSKEDEKAEKKVENEPPEKRSPKRGGLMSMPDYMFKRAEPPKKPWTEEEISMLCRERLVGISIKQMAAVHERSEADIADKMREIGLI